MNDKWRIGLTLIFWIVGIGITLLFLSNVAAGILSDWLVIVPLIITLFATVTLWGVDPSGENKKELPTPLQNNRQGDSTAYTMALLMEMMDEDERQAFKARLQERILSGDMVTDESLIADMEKRKRG